MRKIERYYLKALNWAKRTYDIGRYHVGAIIVQKSINKIVSTGRNLYLQKGPKYTYHAEEIAVLKRMPERMVGGTIFVASYRFTKHGERKPLYSRPCRRCISLLYKIGLKRMVYRDQKGILVGEKIPNPE